MNHSDCKSRIQNEVFISSIGQFLLALHHRDQSNLKTLYIGVSNAVIYLCEQIEKKSRPVVLGEVLFSCTSDATISLALHLMKKFAPQFSFDGVASLKYFLEVLNRCMAKHGGNDKVRDQVKSTIFKCVSGVNSSDLATLHCFNDLNLVQAFLLEAVRSAKGQGVYRKNLLPRRVLGQGPQANNDVLAEIKKKLQSHMQSGVSLLASYRKEHQDFNMDSFLSGFTSFEKRLILRRLEQLDQQ
jgi:hypothetical protein